VKGRIAPTNLYCDGNKMTQLHEVAISRPLAVGSVAVLCTIFIHALAIGATVNFFRYERKRGRAGTGLLVDLPILVLTIAFAFVAHLIEIAVWAVLFVICGEFKNFAAAYYHSAVNYSTLGYGDVIMSPSWKLLGPLEAADGALMFGFSTAMIFAVIQRLILTRFADLRAQ
jgi:Ion channel